MAQQPTLGSIFEATKGDLASSLSGLMLPKDTERVQTVITEYLNQVCDENSEYRQNLTQSEDYILQAALSMLNAQRALVATFDCKPQYTISTGTSGSSATEKQKASLSETQQKSTTTFIGVGGGAMVGNLLLGGWGAVFGAIAGTAIALYLSQKTIQPSPSRISDTLVTAPKVIITDTPVDITALLTVIAQICDSLDNLIATFRAQIQRVVTKYESQQAPSLEDDYIDLLEKIQALIGASAMSKENDSRPKRIEQRMQLLEECLENYNLKVVTYNGQNDQLFIFQPSTNVTDTVMVLPAITKNESIVIKGKVFTKQ